MLATLEIALLLVVATLPPSSIGVAEERAGAPHATGVVPFSASALKTSDTCRGTSLDSSPLQFSRVTLVNAKMLEQRPLVPGREGRGVARTQHEWADLWGRIADSVSAPSVNLQGSVLVVVASPVMGSGPYNHAIEDARLCRNGREIVVLLRIHRYFQQTDEPVRSINAIKISQGIVGDRKIRFIDRSQITHR